MSNMLIYVEENLNYLPELCYATERAPTKKDDEKDSLEESKNVPLVSPQSTLGPTPFRPPPGFSPSAESVNLQLDAPNLFQEAVKQPLLQNALKPSDLLTLGARKPSTNPFLQDESVYDQFGQNLSPQQFIKLWNENLNLQMQITAAFNALLTTVMNNSRNTNSLVGSDSGKLSDTELRLDFADSALGANNKTHKTNLPNETFLFPDETATAGGNFIDTTFTENRSFAVASTTADSPEKLNDAGSNRYGESKYAKHSDNTKSPFAAIGDQHNSNMTREHVDLFNSIHSKSFQNGDQQSSTNGFSAAHFTSESFTGDKCKFDRRDNVLNDTENGYVETNPFKLSLAGKLQISDSTDDITHNCTNALSSTTNNFQASTDFCVKADERCDDKFKSMTNDTSVTNDLHNDNSAVCESIRKLVNHEFPFIERSFSFHDENVDEFSDSLKQHYDYVPPDYVPPDYAPPDYAWKSENTKQPKRADHNAINDQLNKIHQSTPENSLKWGSYDIFSYSFLPSGTDVQDKDQTETEQLKSEPYFPPPPELFASKGYDTKGLQTTAKIQKPIGHNSRETSSFSSTFQENCNHDAAREDFLSASNFGLSNAASTSWSPINSAMPSLITINPNVDEGYITRPSTSHTSQSGSPPVQQSDTTQISDLRGTGLPSESWVKSLEMTVNGQSNENSGRTNSSTQSIETVVENPLLPSTIHRRIEEIRCPLPTKACEAERKIMSNGTSEELSKCKVRMLDGNGSCGMEEKEFTEFWRSGTSDFSKPQIKLFSRDIELSRGAIHIFHYKGEGWLLTDEFVRAFTEFKTATYMSSLLDILNVNVPFIELDGSENSIEISELGSTTRMSSWKVVRNFSKMHLMPLKSILKVLKKLGMITQEDINNTIANREVVSGTIIHEVWTVINVYAEFKCLIEVPE